MESKPRTKILLTILAITCLVVAAAAKEDVVATQIEVNSDGNTTVADSDNLMGKIKINGLYYSAMCDCGDENDDEMSDEFGPKCDPSEFNIHQDKKGQGVGPDVIRTLIGMPAELNFVNVETSSFHCLDGRNPNPILSTLGGDSGEFLLALHIYKTFVDRNFTQEAIDHYLVEYLKYMKHDTFYMCTDDAAVNHLQTELSVDGINLHHPREQLRKQILESLLEPENTGDSHLRLLLKNADKYSIDKELVKMFITSYFTLLWDQTNDYSSKLQLEILAGDHNESAFLEMRSTEACTKAKLAPLIRTKEPKKDGLMIFVNHLDAVQIRRADLAKFFTKFINRNQDGIDAETFYQRMNHHGFLFLDNTGASIAKGLPFYTVHVT